MTAMLNRLCLFGLLLLFGLHPVLAQEGGRGESSDQAHGSGNGNSQSSSGENPGDRGNQGNGNASKGEDSRSQTEQEGQSRKSRSDIPADEETALDAVEQGRALPLEAITARIRETTPGTIIDAELMTVQGFLLYEVKVLQADGSVARLYYYAQSGRRVSPR